jgi:TolB-like protein/Tfp pilus assembly protein PilF
MPPEHLMGDPVDARGDLYSLGVMLYELLTGRRPFRGPDAMALTMAILTEPTPRASGSNAAVPPALDAIVFRAMSRLPQDRYAAAAEMAADLRRAGEALVDTPTRRYTGMKRLRDKLLAIQHHIEAETALSTTMLGSKTAAIAAIAGAVALVAFLGRLWTAGPIPGPTRAQAIRMAILPCQNIGSPDDQFWADGLTETIISDVSMFPNLRVISRSAVMRYKNKAADPRQVARELGVDALLESTFQRAQDRLRISARLIRADDGFEMWAGRYEQPVGGIFEVQDALATQLARALHVQLDSDASHARPHVGTRDLKAYELYLQGRYFFYQYDRPGIERAIELYRLALIRDPDFGLAHAGLSLCYSQYGNFQWDLSPAWLDRAVEAAQRALATDPDQAEGHFALAFARHQRGEFEPALKEFERTIELNPSHAHGHAEIAMIEYQSHCQIRRAVEEYETALLLDPYLLTALWYRSYLYTLMGDFGRAAASLDRARQLSPQSEYTYMFGVALSDISGDMREGLHARELMLAKAPQNPLLHWISGLGYESFGNHALALREFDTALRLSPHFFLAEATRARVLARMGRREEALLASRAALTAPEIPIEQCKSCQLWFSRPVARAWHAAILDAMGKTRQGAQEFQALTASLEGAPASACAAYQLARAYAVNGRVDQSLMWLERAIGGGCEAYGLFRVEPDFRALQNDPRFVKLVQAKAKS